MLVKPYFSRTVFQDCAFVEHCSANSSLPVRNFISSPQHLQLDTASYAMMDLKSRISTPLEAGTSILDVHRLPSYLVPALEYTSKRLAEKGLHVTFVVARRDYQLPGHSIANNSIVSADLENTIPALPTPPCSPASPDVACGPGLTTFRSLVRSQSQQTLRATEKSEFARPKRSKTGPLSRKSSLATLFDSSLGSRRLLGLWRRLA